MSTFNTNTEQSIAEPKFKKGESCIRNYGGGKRQLVFIDECFYKKQEGVYYYEYSYFPSSDGFCYEDGLRKLTEIEKKQLKKSPLNMPMDMCSWNNDPF